MYYYVVTSQFEETESVYSNEVGASPMDFVNLTLSSVDGVYGGGDEFDIIVSMDNPSEVAGIQIVLQDTPESVTMTNVEGIGRLEGEDLNSLSADFDGQLTVLWFSFTGAVIEPGSGEIVKITYQVNEGADGGPCEISFNDTEAGTAISDSAGNAFFFTGNSQTVNIANAVATQTGRVTLNFASVVPRPGPSMKPRYNPPAATWKLTQSGMLVKSQALTTHFASSVNLAPKRTTTHFLGLRTK